MSPEMNDSSDPDFLPVGLDEDQLAILEHVVKMVRSEYEEEISRLEEENDRLQKQIDEELAEMRAEVEAVKFRHGANGTRWGGDRDGD